MPHCEGAALLSAVATAPSPLPRRPPPRSTAAALAATTAARAAAISWLGPAAQQQMAVAVLENPTCPAVWVGALAVGYLSACAQSTWCAQLYAT